MTVRVGFFLPHFEGGGIEKIVLNLLQRMSRRKIEPVLILGTRRGTLLEHLPPGIAVHDLGGAQMRRAPFVLARVLKRLRCDVVYSGTNAANLALLAGAMTMRNPPRTMISEHTPMQLFFNEAKWRGVRRRSMRFLYRRADMIAVPYAELGDELCTALDAPDLTVREVLNPVLETSAITAHDPSVVEDPPYFLAVGRLEKVKGFDLLISAFAQLARAHSTARLVILGDGSERNALIEQAQQLRLEDRVCLPGFIADPAPWFRSATALVVSSRREGTPNVIVEAMAAGTPVLTSDCSYGPCWLVNDGAAGLIADPNYSDAFAEAMLRFLQETELATRLRAAGSKQARRFTFENTVPAFENAFAELADGHRAAVFQNASP